MKVIKKAVILAGGLGTRFLPASKAIPKEMFPVLDKPILQYLVEELSSAGIKDIIIVAGRDKESVIKHFKKNAYLENRLKNSGKTKLLKKVKSLPDLAKLTFIKNVKPLGSGYALLKAQKYIKNEPFILLTGDELGYYPQKTSVQQMLEAYYKYDKNILAVKTVPKEKMVNYGMVSGEKTAPKNYLVTNLVEKPKLENVTSTLAVIGKYIFKEEALLRLKKQYKTWKKAKVFKELTYNDVIISLVKESKVHANVIDCVRYDTGSKLGFVTANIDFALKDKEVKDELLDYLKKIVEKSEN